MKLNRLIILFLACVCLLGASPSTRRNFQIGFGTINSSSIFDTFSTTKGTRPFPSMDETERDNIATPATGLMIYNTDTNKTNFFNGTLWGDESPEIAGNSNSLDNIGVDNSSAADALTVSLKQADGSTDPAAGTGAVKVSFRDSTAADGGFIVRSVTAALSFVIPSGATLGHSDGTDGFVYVYLLNSAGTVEVAVSSKIHDESSVQTTVAITTGSDDDDLYSTTLRSNVAIRLIARLTSNQVTAGTWALVATENSPGPATFTHLDRKVETPKATGPFVIVSAFIDATSGTPILSNQHGTWISSLTDSGVGLITVNIITGVFSDKIHCNCRSAGGTIVNCQSNTTVALGPGTISLKTNATSTNAAIDSRVSVICFGPK